MTAGLLDLSPPVIPSTQRDHVPTVLAAGLLAATLAAICHETVGHGIGCMAAGGDVQLLTSIWFRCRGATSLTDAGGAISGVLCGGLALALTRRLSHPALRLMLFMFGALSLLWVAAQLIAHPVLDHDDWHFIALRRHWPWVWRPLLATVGVISYAGIMRWIALLLRDPVAPSGRAICLAYTAAAISAVLAGSMWAPLPARSALEGLLTLGVAPIGVLIAAARIDKDRPAGALICKSWIFVVVSLLVFAMFALVQGRGLGPLADSTTSRPAPTEFGTV
jgi:hypothetical protein